MRLTRRTMTWGAIGLATVAALGWMLRARPLEVEVRPVARETLRVTIEEPGLTRMPHHAEVSAPSSGRLAEALVRVGDSVRVGQAVAALRPAPLDARALAEAEAAVRAAIAREDEAAALARQAEVALGEAQRDRARAERLAAAGGIAPRELEAAVDLATMRLREVEAARARVKAAAGEMRRARAATRGASPDGPATPVVLRAPMAGRVLRVFEDHDRVVAAGTPVLEVGDPSRLEVELEVLSRDAAGVREGLPVTYQLPSGDTAAGVVVRVAPAAVEKLSALGIREQRVRVVTRPLAPLAGIGDRFELPSAIVTWEGRDVLVLPASALVPLGDGWGVFVLRDGQARRVKVTLGHRGARAVEVTSGLSAGDPVLVLPDARVADGVRVRAAR